MKGCVIYDKENILKATTYAAVFGLVGGMTFEGANHIYKNNIAAESSATASTQNISATTLSSTSTKIQHQTAAFLPWQTMCCHQSLRLM